MEIVLDLVMATSQRTQKCHLDEAKSEIHPLVNRHSQLLGQLSPSNQLQWKNKLI
jgi:hypothetical protein